jgi:DNA modification methylase
MDVLRTMDGESVEAVVCDPPYGIRYQNKRAEKRRDFITNDQRPFVWWLWECSRLLKPGGALVCFCRWDVQAVFACAIQTAGLKVRSQWVWDRLRHGMGDCRATLAPRHEVMWFATKGRFRFPGGRPKSVLDVASVHGAKRVHPTEKPAALMRELVRWVTPRGGRVLDPCMGSGATGECVRDGFSFTGIEIERRYYREAVRRMRSAVRELKGSRVQR